MSTSDQQKNKKIILVILLLTPIAVMLAATLTFKLGYVPATKKNHGVLLQPPHKISEFELLTPHDAVYNYVEDNKEYGRWTIFIFGDQNCADAICQQQLWLARQAHMALGHRAQYVKRYYVAVGGRISDTLATKLKVEHPRLSWLYTSANRYEKFISTVAQQQFNPLQLHQFVIVDPNAWMMMYYTRQHGGQDVIADLKYLLKKRGK